MIERKSSEYFQKCNKYCKSKVKVKPLLLKSCYTKLCRASLFFFSLFQNRVKKTQKLLQYDHRLKNAKTKMQGMYSSNI